MENIYKLYEVVNYVGNSVYKTCKSVFMDG